MAREQRYPVESFSAGQPTIEKLVGFPASPGSGLIKASATPGKIPRIPGASKMPRAAKLPKLPKAKIPRKVTN
jgi:hypothetical protein